MIDNRLKRCCSCCNDIDVKTKAEDVMANGELINRDVQIYCIHEKVCKRLIEHNERFGV